jgi:hypothetical protein
MLGSGYVLTVTCNALGWLSVQLDGSSINFGTLGLNRPPVDKIGGKV